SSRRRPSRRPPPRPRDGPAPPHARGSRRRPWLPLPLPPLRSAPPPACPPPPPRRISRRRASSRSRRRPARSSASARRTSAGRGAMTTLGGCVLRDWAKVFFLRAFGCPRVVFVIDLVDNLDKYLARGVSKQHLALSYVYYLPETVTLVFPVAVLFAVVFTVGALGRHAELTAAKASGISFHRLVRPLLAASLAAVLVD